MDAVPQPPAAQQPAAPRTRIPIPPLQPYLQVVGEPQGDICHWFLNLDAYLDCVDRNQDPQHPLQDLDKIALLISHLGQEGLRSFGGTPEFAARNQATFEQLREQVVTHFRRAPSVFKARYDFFTRRQESGESVKEFLQALRALSVDCGFEMITQQESVNEHLKTQLVCHTIDVKAQTELFAHREMMNLQDVINFLGASEAVAQDNKAIGGTQQESSVIQATCKYGRVEDREQHDWCSKCGHQGHQNGPSCPAVGKTCFECGGSRHFGSMCSGQEQSSDRRQPRGRGRGRRTARGRGRGGQTYEALGFTIQCEMDSKAGLIRWKFPVSDGGRKKYVKFMVDSGATVSLLSLQTYKRRFGYIPLQKIAMTITDAEGRPFSRVLGTIPLTVGLNNQWYSDRFHVVDGARDLLGNNFLKPLRVQIDCGRSRLVAGQGGRCHCNRNRVFQRGWQVKCQRIRDETHEAI